MDYLISIFTPTYNRAKLLPQLYESLIAQNHHNFEWIIVDDGSHDNTDEIVANFLTENKIPITYFKKENQGKHLAINKGIELSSGELFFIVDSDDYLLNDATKIIAEHYPYIKSREEMAGISFRRGISTTEYIGSKKTFANMEVSALEFRFKHCVKGDMAEVFKTKVIKQFSFPIIEGETFCTEGLLWNRIALNYKLLWISKIIYIGIYLEGGLTDNSFKLRKNAPKYATLYYKELTQMPIPIIQKIKAGINYWRFAKFLDTPFIQKWRNISPLLSIIALPLSLIFLLKDPQ